MNRVLRRENLALVALIVCVMACSKQERPIGATPSDERNAPNDKSDKRNAPNDKSDKRNAPNDKYMLPDLADIVSIEYIEQG